MTPFDYVNSITHNKKDMMRGTENDELAEKGYQPFIVNRTLSYHQDCVYFANEINQRSHLDNLLQYDFFINMLRPRKRFAKWAKPTKNEDLEAVMEFFCYSRAKAEAAIAALSKEQVAMIKEKLIKGGKNGGSK